MADPSEAGLTPTKKWSPASLKASAGLDENSMMQFLMPAEKLGSMINITTYNELLDQGIPFILTNLFNVTYRIKDVRDKTPMDRKRESVEIKLRFSDVKIGRPTYSDFPFGKIQPLYPNMARLSGRTYAAELSLAAEVTLTAHYTGGETSTLTAKVPPFPLAKIPIMVGCNRCHTWNLPREARKYLKEDPNENGGYFLAKGGEWVVQWLENVRYNFLHVHKKTKSGEHVRGEFLSQPGGAFENSSQIIIRYMDSGALTIEINNPNFAKTKIPFYIVFRLLGMTSDNDIVDSIAYGFSSGGDMDQETTDIVEIIDRAYRHVDKTFKEIRHELDRAELVRYIAERLSSYVSNTRDYLEVENSIRYLNTNLIRILDMNFLPHLGIGPSKRGEKLRFLGSLIRGTLQVALGIMPPTDRDNYANKRVHGAGVSIAKAIKTQFNSGVVKPIINSLRQTIRHTEFEKLRPMDLIKLVQTKATSVNLGRTLEQAITSGEGKIRINRKVLTNRVASQALERKNPSNYLSAMRGLSAHAGSNKASKQTARADEMRRVHPSFLGYVCITKSADTGENVGMNKELALTATVCTAGQPFNLINHLKRDPDLIPLAAVQLVDIARLGYSRVYVNGVWVGCVQGAQRFVDRYRALRRESRVVDPQTSIIWYPVTGDIHFCLDVGRLIRPLLIVDNNLEEYKRAVRAGEKGAEFLQTIRLTPDHVKRLAAGLITLEDLRQAGIFEWISAGEAENILIASSIDMLRGRAHNPLDQYTHCDVPQSVMGITAHLSPYGNHTQMARVTYETNQGRSSGGWYSLAAPFRVDKGRFFQYYIEYPLVHTLTAGRVLPSSSMTMVAYMFLKGYNQEDSGIIKLSYAQRQGFAGVYSTKMDAVLDNGEKFGTPDPLITKNMKPDASYEKLEGAVVPKGTVLYRGDVVIGVIAQAAGRGEEKYKYVDRSVVYYHSEPATVTEVYKTHDSIGNEKIIVKLSYHREVAVGDKLSSRSGNKMIIAIIVPDADMPYNDKGVTPDIVINNHSIPSRMTIGQLLETMVSYLCMINGTLVDGTTYRRVDPKRVARQLEAEGARYSARERMYNGQTGEYDDAAIVMAPTASQRILKFVADDKYVAPAWGPTNATTQQPLEGKNARGGLRVGEMEVWVLNTHGAMANLIEKLYNDSDGQKYHLCRKCGHPAIYNPYRSIYRCRRCGEGADICTVDSCHAVIVALEEIRSANFDIKLDVRPFEFEEFVH
jgi:DNA-directed RNA polymerase beta subunit